MTFHQTHKKPTIHTTDNERFTLLFYLRKRGRTNTVVLANLGLRLRMYGSYLS